MQKTWETQIQKTWEALDTLKDVDTGVSGTDAINIIEQTLTEFQALKKSPTSDEVCKALSEHEKRNVRYSEKTHEFYYLEYEGEIGEYQQFITETYGDGLWSLGVYLPPHIITLIGRFYEGLEVKE